MAAWRRLLRFVSIGCPYLLMACAPGAAREAATRPRTETATVAATPTPAQAQSQSQSESKSESDGEGPRLRELQVDGFLPALLFSPAGDGQARLIVATHGAGGAPEWECDYWRRLSAGGAFVLCLRGKSMGGGSYYYPNHHELAAELRAAERAARAAEPRILRSNGVYAGFSQGASMGSAIIARHATTLPYVVLIEGFELWNVPRARAFARAGGRRVLLVCGTKQCDSTARESARWIAEVGLDVRVEYAAGAGHTAGGEVMERLAGALGWLLRDE
jgi:predicted esterase